MKVFSQWIHYTVILHPVRLELLPLRSLCARSDPPQNFLSSLFVWVRLPAISECLCTSESIGPYSKGVQTYAGERADFQLAGMGSRPSLAHMSSMSWLNYSGTWFPHRPPPRNVVNN